MRPRDPEKRESIRKAAMKLFFEMGLEGFSMQKLARESGVSPATLYIYFQDRDDLIIQLCREEIIKMNESVMDGFDPEMDFASGLEIQWRNRTRYFLSDPLASHFMEQMRYSAGYYEKAMAGIQSGFADVMRRFVKNAIARKEIDRLPVEVFWSVAFAPLYQLLKMHIHRTGFPTMKPFQFNDAIMLQTLKLVLKGLKPGEAK